MSDTTDKYLTPEAKARVQIDKMLVAAGWVIQDRSEINLYAGAGVAIREYLLKGGLEADYLLFINGKAVGALEAKKEGSTLTGVEHQSAKDDSEIDASDLPDPDLLIAEIVEELTAAALELAAAASMTEDRDD